MNLDNNKVVEENGDVPGGNYQFKNTNLPDPDASPDYFETSRHFHLILNRGLGRLSMSVNESLALDTLLDADLTQSPCQFTIGVYYAASSHPIVWEGYYDNVVITAQ